MKILIWLKRNRDHIKIYLNETKSIWTDMDNENHILFQYGDCHISLIYCSKSFKYTKI